MKTTESSTASVKLVGTNGQISLGKQFAGRQVLVEEPEPGVWLIRTATVIPDNERWIHEAGAMRGLERALSWARANPPNDSSTDEILENVHAGL